MRTSWKRSWLRSRQLSNGAKRSLHCPREHEPQEVLSTWPNLSMRVQALWAIQDERYPAELTSARAMACLPPLDIQGWRQLRWFSDQPNSARQSLQTDAHPSVGGKNPSIAPESATADRCATEV